MTFDETGVAWVSERRRTWWSWQGCTSWVDAPTVWVLSAGPGTSSSVTVVPKRAAEGPELSGAVADALERHLVSPQVWPPRVS